MTRSIAAVSLALATCAAGAALSGCTSHPYIVQGDAKSVEVSYGSDVARALPLARRHCAQFERVPRLVDSGAELALFDCVRP